MMSFFEYSQARLVTNLEHLNVEEERVDGGSGEGHQGKEWLNCQEPDLNW